jgi:hypothetical protein
VVPAVIVTSYEAVRLWFHGLVLRTADFTACRIQSEA